MRAAAGVAESILGSDEIFELRAEIANALEASRQTGQLNPRAPGAVNNFIQLAKKVMRRSLTWYTRPLHMFEGAAIRALQHAGNIVDQQRGHLQKLSETLNLHADLIERNRAWTVEQVQSEATSHREKLQHLSEQVEVSVASYEQKLSRLASVHDERLLALEASLNSYKGVADRGECNAHEIERLDKEVQTLRGESQQLLLQTRQAASQQRIRERDMRRKIHTLESGPQQHEPAAISPVPPMFPSEITDEAQFDYFAFEEQYRGSEADIRERQQAYLEYFQGRDNVVDIGCGRGEFLELLRDNGISAHGVELGTDQYLLCKEKGLDVVQQDLFTFLESTPDESLGGIFSAQVIEHMTASDQLRYVALAYRKTKPGSPVIFETINPECVFALVHNFFLDPTHVRPTHPLTLRFAMESHKFRSVELRFSAPAGGMQIPRLYLDGGSQALDHFNAGIERLNELLYGYQDYAAIGWK